MRRLLYLAFLPFALGASCDGVTDPMALERFYPVPGALVIENRAAEPLYTIAIDAEDVPLVDWVPCIEDQCGMVDATSTRLVPNDSILGSDSSGLVYVYYWRRACCGPADGLIPGPVHLKKVRLRSSALY